MMSDHSHLMARYKPSIGTDLTYPVDSQYLNSTIDPWEFQPGYNKAAPTPTNKTLWAEVGGDVAAYKAAFVKSDQGAFRKPFKESTMMVAPVKWDTGYTGPTEEVLSNLALMRGEAIRVKDAIGVVNNSIQRLEGLLYQVQNDLKGKYRLRNNTAYARLAADKAPEILKTLDGDIATLESLSLTYSTQLGELRSHGRVLNEELELLLREYKEDAAKLNINDGFAAELRRAAGSGAVKGFTFGSIGGVVAAGALVFIIAQSRRATRRVRSTARGANGLFFRA